MNINLRSLAIWLSIGAFAIFMAFSVSSAAKNNNIDQLPLSEVEARAEAGDISKIKIDGRNVIGEFSTGGEFRSVRDPIDQGFTQRMLDNDVAIEVAPEQNGGIGALLFQLLPIIIVVGIMIYIMRQMQAGGGRGAMSG